MAVKRSQAMAGEHNISSETIIWYNTYYYQT